MTDNQKWLFGVAATLLVQVFIVAVAWGRLTTTVAQLEKEIVTLQQSCISKEVYQTDMKWIDAITDEYYQGMKKK